MFKPRFGPSGRVLHCSWKPGTLLSFEILCFDTSGIDCAGKV